MQTVCHAHAGVGVQMCCMWKQISRKEKTTKKKTYLGVDDGCMHVFRCVACGCRLVQTKNKIKNEPTDGVVDTACRHVGRNTLHVYVDELHAKEIGIKKNKERKN